MVEAMARIESPALSIKTRLTTSKAVNPLSVAL